MALREYLISISRDRPELNNFEILVDNGIRQILPGEIHPALDHLTMRVGMDYNLPAGIDLLKDARQVIQILSRERIMVENPENKILMYGTTWCGATRRARRQFEEGKIDYLFIDIDQDETAAQYVMSVARGYRSVPTIVFQDGSILVEPSSYVLQEKLDQVRK